MVWGSIPHEESRIFSLSNARERMKNIFLYFFTEPKTYPLSYSIGETFWKIATGNNRVYLHVTFGGIFTIHQGLISCPFHWKTALKISNITFWKSQKIMGSDRSVKLGKNKIRVKMIDKKFYILCHHHTNLKSHDNNNTLAKVIFFTEVQGQVWNKRSSDNVSSVNMWILYI